MYMDANQMLSVDQAVAANAASANVIDLGAPDAGKSKIGIFCRVSEAFNNLTSLGVKLQTATDSAFTTPVDLPVQETPLLADLTLNSLHLQTDLPVGCRRYIRLYYTVIGAAPTTGKITAGLILDRQTNP